jgi:hypothetical protein
MARHQSYSQVSYGILPPPHVASARVWANGVFAGILAHANGVEKKTVMRTESVHYTFDPVASGFDPAKDMVVPPHKIDPQITTGETA